MTPDNDELSYNEIESILKTKTVIICGDFNLPHINWKAVTFNSEGSTLLTKAKSYTFLSL